MHPLLTPKLNNITLRHAVKEYLGNIKAKLYLISKYGDISQWDVSNVTNMSSLFANAHSFNQPLDKWEAILRFAPAKAWPRASEMKQCNDN